jgi:hypothetical protein
MDDIAQLIAGATAARTRLLVRIRGLSAAQGAFKPDPGEWSIAENVEHLVLAEQSSINRVWAAAEGLRHGRTRVANSVVLRGRGSAGDGAR